MSGNKNSSLKIADAIMRWRYREWAAVAAVLALYLYLALRYWKYPGYICDWLYSEQTALDIMARLERGMSPLRVFLEGNRRVDDYHGTLTGTMFAPLFMLFGPSWFLARLYPIAFGALTLVLTYRFCRELFGFTAAILSIFLLAIHEPYILGTKLGDWFVNHAQVFSMGSLLFLTLWWKNRKTINLALGMALLGMGFGTRLWFVWYPAALLIYGSLWFVAFFRNAERKIPWVHVVKSVFAGTAAFLAGYWLSSKDPTIAASNDYILSATVMCISPANPNGLFFLKKNLAQVLEIFNSLISGDSFERRLCSFGYPFMNPLAPFLFWGITALSAIVILPQRSADRKKWFFIASLFALMFCLAALNVPDHAIHVEPLFFLYPFPQVLEAVGLSLLWKRDTSHYWRVFLGAILALLVGMEIQGVVRAERYLKETGGRRNYSRSIYDLADWARHERASGSGFLVFYYNTSAHLYLLTSDPYFRLITLGTRQFNRNFFSYDFVGQTGEKCWILQNDDPGPFKNLCEQVLPHINQDLFVVDTQFTDMPDHFVVFAKQARKLGFELTLYKQFADDDGASVFDVYALKPPKRKQQKLSANSGPALTR